MADSTVRLVFTSQSGDATRGVKQIESAFVSLERTGARAARAIGTVAFGAIAAGIGISVKSAVDFDKAMRNVNSIARVSETQFKGMEKQVLSLARSSGQAPKVLAEGLYDIVSSGFKANDALRILDASAKAARAGLTDTATSTKGVVAVLNAYHLGANDAATVSDQLFKTVEVGVIRFEELASQIGDVLPFASSLGIGLDQVGASVATLTKEGLSGAEAITRIKGVMVQFLSPSKDLAKAIKDAGFESGEAMLKAKGFQGSLDLLARATGGSKTEMSKLFPDVRALGGALGLTGENSKSAKRDLEALKDALGATGKAADEQAKSISAKWQKMVANLQAGSIVLGTALFPVLDAVISKMTDVAMWFGELAEKPTLKLKAEFALDGIKDAASGLRDQITSALDEALNGTSFTPTAKFNSAVGLIDTPGMLEKIGSIDWNAVGVKIADGLKSALTVTETAWDNLVTGAIGAIERNRGRIADAGAQIGVAIFAKLTDPSWWIAHWDLAAAVLLTAIPGGKLARVGEKAVALLVRPFARFGQAVAGLLGDGLLLITGTVERFAPRLGNALLRVILSAGSIAGRGLGALACRGGDIGSTIGRAIAARTPGFVKVAIKFALASGIVQGAAGVGGAIASAVGSVQDKLSAKLRSMSLKEAIIGVLRLAVLATPGGIAGAIFSLGANFGAMIRSAIGAGLSGLGGYISGLVSSAIANIRPPKINLGSLVPGLATGGLVPGPRGAGDVVPAMLTPGEVVLNEKQQALLGKDRIMSVLSATGGQVGGRAFAKGGIVTAGKNLSKKLSGAVGAIVRAIEGTQLAESDNERSYGQLDRQFSISQEQFIVSDANGNESLDSSAVNQRLGEIGQLEASRRGLMGLLDREKGQLAAAVETLKRSIDQLNPMIRRARTQAHADARTVAKIEKDLSKERAKKNPSKGRISALESRKRKISKRQGTLEGYVSDWTGLVGDFSGLSKDEAARLHDVPFDRRDAELGILELQSEAGEIRALRPSASAGGAGADSAGDAELQALVAQLRQALDIGGIQGAIIGSFARGTIHVPETGLALVHAGETIIPDAQSARYGGGSGGPITIELHGDLALASRVEPIVRGMYAETVQVVNRRLGDRADGLRRSGAVR